MGSATKDALEGCIVVGCGLESQESLKGFLSQVELRPELCVLVVVDLPVRESTVWFDALERSSALPVQVIDSDTILEAGTIYLCGNLADMVCVGKTLKVAYGPQYEKRHETLDTVLRAMSQWGERAAFVALQGCSLRRVNGLNQFKMRGGLVLEEQAEDGRENLGDGVDQRVYLPDMVNVLVGHFDLKVEATSEEERRDGELLSELLQHLHKLIGIDFSQYQTETLRRRIFSRMRRHELDTLGEYLALVQDSRVEALALYEEFVVGVTRFFRDPDAYELLRERVISELIGRTENGEELRIWVPGTATGEEAFSIAILLEEVAKEVGVLDLNYKIFATDVHEASLRQGVQAAYRAESLEGVDQVLIERYFTRVGSVYVVKNYMRRRVVFAKHDILKDPPFSKLDFVSCRNLLIYLKPAAQKKAMGFILFSMRVNGILWLGSSESPTSYIGQIAVLDSRWRLYRKKSETFVSPTLLRGPDAQPGDRVVMPSPMLRLGRADTSISNSLLSVLDRLLPTSIVIGNNGDVLHTFGDCGRYFDAIKGRVSLSFEDRIKPELVTTIRRARDRVRASGVNVSARCVMEGDDGKPQVVDLKVEMLEEGQFFSGAVLVVFELQNSSSVAYEEYSPLLMKSDEGADESESVTDLREELKALRQRLSETVTQLEQSNQELQLSNEELLTSNEELQSTNEELHSVNEELFAVNAEYEAKNKDLVLLNEDINNLLRCTEIGTVFVQEDLRIRKITPMAERILNLVPEDVGRPIDHISHNMKGYEGLADDARGVILRGEPVEREAQLEDGTSLLVRILPFRTNRNEVNGAVITTIDVTRLKFAEKQFVESQRRLQLALEAANFGVWSYDFETDSFDCDERVDSVLGLRGPSEKERVQVLERMGLSLETISALSKESEQRLDNAFDRSMTLVRSSGESRYVHTRGLFYWDATGKLIRCSGVMWDETESKLGEQMVLQKKNDLETLLYVVSHDLREPLRAVQSFSSLLLDRYGEQLEGKGKDYLNRIKGGGDRMSRLLDDVLSLSRINRMDDEREYCSGNELVEAALKSLDGRIHELEAKVVVSEDLPELRVNYVYAKQAVVNLIGNALKFTPEGERPQIEIGPYAGENPRLVGMVVRDRGVGVPAESEERIFKLFQRGVGRDVEGTGAGLAIVKQVALKHGGDAWYEPRMGGGSKFTITFSY